MQPKLTIAATKRIVGSLSFPSKMPGTAFALPAKACHIGAKLAQKAGTVCSGCYALAGRANYQQPNAVKGAYRRLAGITHPLWVAAMVRLLSHTHDHGPIKIDLGLVGVRRQKKGGSRHQWNEPGWHRWHDSGDLQSVEHLAKICEVARQTPNIKHWLPTLEAAMVQRYLANGGSVPDNLVIRISSPMIDQPKKRDAFPISSVFSVEPDPDAHVCPARHQEHRCGTCRACWSAAVSHVAYPVH